MLRTGIALMVLTLALPATSGQEAERDLALKEAKALIEELS